MFVSAIRAISFLPVQIWEADSERQPICVARCLVKRRRERERPFFIVHGNEFTSRLGNSASANRQNSHQFVDELMPYGLFISHEDN